MRRHRDAMGWSLQLRSKTYFVYHRFNPEGKLVGKTTGEQDREKALKKALEIVCEARAELTRIAEGDDYPNNFADAVEEMRAEEEKLLGNELDKTNPRMTTLWKLGDTWREDTGWLADWLRENSPRSTMLCYRTVWKFFVETHPHLVRIKEARPEHFQACFDLKKKDVEPYTLISLYHSGARGIFKHLIKQGWYQGEVPVPHIELQRNRIEHRKPQDILSEKELDELQAVFDEFGHGFDVAFNLMRFTGMRKSESANLLWDEVHLDVQPHPYLQIQPHEGDAVRGITKSTIKTRSSIRTVPIRKELLTYLSSRREDTGYVVPKVGCHWDRMSMRIPDKLQNAIKKTCPRFHFHLLRHTFISNALMAGVPPVKVSKWVGDSLGMILSTYTHCIPDSDINF